MKLENNYRPQYASIVSFVTAKNNMKGEAEGGWEWEISP